MILSYKANQEATLRATLMVLLIAAFVGYSFMVISLLKFGTISLPFGPKPAIHHLSVITPRVKNDPGKSWTYNFATMPTGSLPSLDWNFEVGNKVALYNEEAQTYTARQANVRIEDGALVLEARKENLNGKQFTSGRINTKGIFDFTYGTLEITAQLPEGVGTWPSVWLLPSSPRYKPTTYGVANKDRLAWAVNGEIDVLESIGSLPNQNLPHLHTYNELSAPPYLTPGYTNDAYGAYHRYGVIKTPNKITFTIDGQPFYSQSKTSNNPLDWPYDQPYYLIANLAIGGNWEKTIADAGSWAPHDFKIQSISYKPL